MDHSFEFNAKWDSPDVEVLDYTYSNQKPSKEAYAGTGGSHIPQQSGITGGFPRGDSVYMKWRIKSTNEVFEDKVDLTHRLPRNLKDKRIYCVIDGKQLYVLLIDLNEFRRRVTTEELNASRKDATTPVKKVLATNILHRVQQIYPDPITQLR